MKMWLAAAIVSLVATTASADNNTAMKSCLEKHGYTTEKFHTFDWGLASACYNKYAVVQEKKELKEMREFLKKKPWYKGKDWEWEKTAGYTCQKNYSTGYVICHKPIYLN
jgi:hypothetical protein